MNPKKAPILCVVAILIMLGCSLAVPPKEANAEILRPTAYTDVSGKTADPINAYDDNVNTSADTTTTTDAFPSIIYHTWQTPVDDYSSLTLCVDRSSTGHEDDKWGIRYSTDGGHTWLSLDGMSSKDVGRSIVSLDLDPSQDLSELQIRIDTDRKKKADNGYVSIYEIWTEGEIYVSPTLQQSAYRFFPNIDSVDLSAIVSNVGGADEATAITIHGQYMYIVGFGPGNWRIEKRRLIDGYLEASTTSDSRGDPNGIATDGGYLYIVGDDYLEGNYQWRIEKRDVGDLSLVEGFGPSGDGVIIRDPSDENDSANAIAIDGDYMYIVGSDRSHGDAQWRIEKRRLEDGSLVDEIVNNPSVDNDIPYAIAIDSLNMYVVGYDRIPGSSNKPGKGNKGSSNAEWRIEKRSLSDLSVLQHDVTSDPTHEFDVARGIAIDSLNGYMYVIGSQEIDFFDTAWRIEKRNLGDLSLVSGFGDEKNGIIVEDIGYDDQPQGIAIDDNYMYVAGHSASLIEPDGTADTEWRIEKRNLDNGYLECAVLNDVYSHNNDRARAIAIDSTDMYVAGYDNSGLAEWRIEKRALTDLSLSLLQLQDWPPQDTFVTLRNGDAFRLRILVHVQSGTLLKDGQQFKLQFRDIDCGSCLWGDVTDATAISFNDNPTPYDGDVLLGNSEDPTHNAYTTRNQTYEEANNFTNSVSAVIAGEDAMWDFALLVNDAPAGTYHLRIVKADGTVLSDHAVWPEVRIQ